MRVGAEKICEKLELVREKLDFLKEEALEFLRSYSERIDSYHRAGVLFSISSHFPVVFTVMNDGETLAAVTLSDPFSRSPSPYRMEVGHPEVLEVVEEIFGWEVHGMKAGIFEFPPKTRFLAVVGSESWMKKITFQEKLKGEEILSFAEKIDDEKFEILEKFMNSRIRDGVHSSIDDDGLHLTFFAPEWIKDAHIPLLSEMAKVLRAELGLRVSRYSKVARVGKVFTVVTLPIESAWSGEAEKVAEEFLNRLMSGYEGFLKGAGIG